jgi:hypothetical protein
LGSFQDCRDRCRQKRAEAQATEETKSVEEKARPKSGFPLALPISQQNMQAA